jgi:hypothetical protein
MLLQWGLWPNNWITTVNGLMAISEIETLVVQTLPLPPKYCAKAWGTITIVMSNMSKFLIFMSLK